jgi:hypothetical protein
MTFDRSLWKTRNVAPSTWNPIVPLTLSPVQNGIPDGPALEKREQTFRPSSVRSRSMLSTLTWAFEHYCQRSHAIHQRIGRVVILLLIIVSSHGKLTVNERMNELDVNIEIIIFDQS